MPSSYSPNLALEMPATGEQAGTWGDTANSDFGFIDTATDGNIAIALSASSYILNTQQRVVSQGRNKVITWTGALTAACTVTISPNTAQKLYFMRNQTTGGFPIIFSQGTGGTFTLNMGCAAIIYCDGAGNNANVSGAFYNPQFASINAPSATTALAINGPTTINGAATINIPNSAGAAGDLYYRTAAGPLANLPIGTPGQVLQVTTGGALSWAVGVAIGQTIAGSAPNAVYFSDANNKLGQNTQFTFNANGLGLGTPAAHTLHVGINLPPELWLDTNNPGAQYRQILWSTNNSPRWALRSDGTGEPGAGSNGGSNLVLQGFSDAGGALTNSVLFFTRASGNVSIGYAGDVGARLFVVGSNPLAAVMCVRGAASQSQVLELWQNSAGNTLMSVDGNGNLSVGGNLSAGGSVTLTTLTIPAGGTLNSNGSLGVNGTLYLTNATIMISGNAAKTFTVSFANYSGGYQQTLTFQNGILMGHTP